MFIAAVHFTRGVFKMLNGHELVSEAGSCQDIEVGVLLSFSLILSLTLESPIPVRDTESCCNCEGPCMGETHTQKLPKYWPVIIIGTKASTEKAFEPL